MRADADSSANHSMRIAATSSSGLSSFHEVDRGLKQLQVFRVISGVIVVDLYPLPRAGPSVRLEGNNIIPGELKLGGRRCGQPKSHAAAVDAGKHLSVDEVSGQAGHVTGFNAGNLEQQGIDNGFMAVGRRICFQWIGVPMRSYILTRGEARTCRAKLQCIPIRFRAGSDAPHGPRAFHTLLSSREGVGMIV
jgi:hypothetical protein